MPRTIAFDPDAVLDAALDLFWRQGYGATSLPDLEQATGLNRSSLYNTFGPKRDVFYAALDRYRARGAREVAAMLGAESALDGIAAYLRAMAHAPGQDVQLGCLVANAAVELAPADPDASRRAAETFEGMRNQLRDAVARAQTQGDVPAAADVDPLVWLLHTGGVGLRVTARSGMPAEHQDSAVAALLAAIRG